MAFSSKMYILDSVFVPQTFPIFQRSVHGALYTCLKANLKNNYKNNRKIDTTVEKTKKRLLR